MTLLDVQNVTVSFADVPVVRNLSLRVEEGQILGVIGESGSGKSMLALSILQLLPEGAQMVGQVSLAGTVLTELDESALCGQRGKAMSMVFQEPMTALNPLHRIGDQVAEAILQHEKISRAEAQARAAETLARVELDVPLTRFPHELSGGQRQRVCIAMAIALRPRILIADEPTTALDVTTQADILQLLRRLVEADGMGLILISHDLGVVASMADHTVIMRGGRVVEEGRIGTLSHAYSKALMSASEHVPERHKKPTSTPLLRVKDARREYVLPREKWFQAPPVLRAVDGVSFDLKRGENLGLVGESGCGKSTLMRAILGLERLQSGQITLNGELIETADRTVMQAVFQDPYGSFNPRHRVGRLVTEPFHVNNAPPKGDHLDETIADALSRVGLRPEDRHKYIHEFSGGQRQRIAIARALINKPDLIVLDEAVSALDVQVRAQILDLLAELSDQFDLTYLFISHDLSVVRNVTDRVLVMRSGTIVEEGPTADVFDDPQHPYTQRLIAAIPHLPELV